MKLRSMTSLYLWRGTREVLMMYKEGSRAFQGALWIGIGGHMEADEAADPLSAVLREMEEETGLAAGDVTPPELRYISTRLCPGEVRHIYIFTARLVRPDAAVRSSGEGELSWIRREELLDRPMPFTGKAVLGHYLETGVRDQRVYGVSVGGGERPEALFTPLLEYGTDYTRNGVLCV